MNKNDALILQTAEISPQAGQWSRSFDYLIMVVGAFLVWSVTYISQLLLAGDWDFFIDWKDRQYWVLITPPVTMMMAAGFQSIFWKLFRLPLGATASLLLFLIGVWIVRYASWMGLAYFPLSLVIPGTCLMSAIALDAILVLSRSWLITGMLGGVLYGLLFFPSNWITIAAYHQPVEVMGSMTSLADLIGYVFPRSGTPEYIRIIERGTLRTFSDSAIWVSAFFSGFICVFMYYIFWFVGSFACTPGFVAVGSRFKDAFGGNKVAKAGVSA